MQSHVFQLIHSDRSLVEQEFMYTEFMQNGKFSVFIIV